MTDSEFDVLDELYFVISYKDLEDSLPHIRDDLKEILGKLVLKGYVKCLEKDLEVEVLDFDRYNLNYNKYNYLATKAGLLAHNSI